MPAPRAVLIDIANKGLDPKVAYKNLDKNGSLKENIEVPLTSIKKDVQNIEQDVVLIVSEKVSEKEEEQTVVTKPLEKPKSVKKTFEKKITQEKKEIKD